MGGTQKRIFSIVHPALPRNLSFPAQFAPQGRDVIAYGGIESS